MSQNNLKTIKLMVLQDLTYYDAPISDLKISMFADELKAIAIGDLNRAFEHFREERGRSRPPMPADIKAFLGMTAPDDDAVARDCAARIIHAVTKFGYPNWKEAQVYIGSLGWSIVQSLGGWDHFSRNLQTRDETMWLAQLREQAKAVMSINRSGDGDIVIHDRNLPLISGTDELVSGLIKPVDDRK